MAIAFDSHVDYFYGDRLPGERPAAVWDKEGEYSVDGMPLVVGRRTGTTNVQPALQVRTNAYVPIYNA